MLRLMPFVESSHDANRRQRAVADALNDGMVLDEGLTDAVLLAKVFDELRRGQRTTFRISICTAVLRPFRAAGTTLQPQCLDPELRCGRHEGNCWTDLSSTIKHGQRLDMGK